jgi:hypothetical protein
VDGFNYRQHDESAENLVEAEFGNAPENTVELKHG